MNEEYEIEEGYIEIKNDNDVPISKELLNTILDIISKWVEKEDWTSFKIQYKKIKDNEGQKMSGRYVFGTCADSGIFLTADNILEDLQQIDWKKNTNKYIKRDEKNGDKERTS